MWADESRFADILALWQLGFPGDSEEDVRAFWQAVGQKSRCLLVTEGARAVSMAFLIPATGCVGGREWPLWYVYAAVTHPDFRGRGYFARLLNEAAALAAQDGVAGLFLRPAEPSLFGYYSRCGFEPCFVVRGIEWQVNGLYTDIPWKRVTNGYAPLRDQWLKSIGVDFVKWPDNVADLAVKMAEETGGGALSCDWGLVLYGREGNDILVRELLCAPGDRERLCASLARELPCHEMRIQAPVLAGETGESFGMFRPCGAEKPAGNNWYMGLTLE